MKYLTLKFSILYLLSCGCQNPKEKLNALIHDYSKDNMPPHCIILKNEKFDLYAVKDTLNTPILEKRYDPSLWWNFREIEILQGNISYEYERLTIWNKNKPYKYFNDTVSLKKEVINLYKEKLIYKEKTNHILEEYRKKELLEEQINSSWPTK